jgi:membrane-anchored protein YejM (alkaline phosphatase superfamily)
VRGIKAPFRWKHAQETGGKPTLLERLGKAKHLVSKIPGLKTVSAMVGRFNSEWIPVGMETRVLLSAVLASVLTWHFSSTYFDTEPRWILVVITGGAYLLVGYFFSYCMSLLFEWLLRIRCLGLMVSQAVVATCAIGDSAHFNLFGEHFTHANIRLTLEGLLFDEVNLQNRVGLREWLGAFTAIGAYLFLLRLLPALFRKFKSRLVDQPKPFLPRFVRTHHVWLAITGIVLTVSLTIGFSWAKIRSPLFKALPWASLIETVGSQTKVHVVKRIKHMSKIRLRKQLSKLYKGISRQDTTPKIERKDNIVFLHLESLRSDMLTPELMPNLYQFAQEEGILLPNHHTSGTNTGSGAFGALSGLDGMFYQPARSLDLSPLPLKLLNGLGYRQSCFYTKNMDYDDLFSYLFEETNDHSFMASEGPIEIREKVMLDEYLKTFHQTEEPRLDYVMFYTTHYDYYYPDTHEFYTPALSLGFDIGGTNTESRRLWTQREQLLNRYRNATRYLDDLLGQFLRSLKASGALEDTVLLIFGDHGEAFWEHGRFGHTFGFSNKQTQVAAVAHFPGRPTIHVDEPTSHADFFPTIFDYLGLSGMPGQFMTGRSWFTPDSDEQVAVTTRGTIHARPSYRHVLTTKDYRIVFRTMKKGKRARVEHVYDTQHEPVFDVDYTLVNQALRSLDQRVGKLSAE